MGIPARSHTARSDVLRMIHAMNVLEQSMPTQLSASAPAFTGPVSLEVWMNFGTVSQLKDGPRPGLALTYKLVVTYPRLWTGSGRLGVQRAQLAAAIAMN